MFVFGAQYLRGATPEPEDWEEDLKLARELGFNTMRAWICWGYLEPEEGRINFDYLDRFLDTMGRRGLKAVLLFNLYGVPEWAARKYPHCRYVDHEGLPAEPNAASSIPTGGWPGLCFDNREVREIAERFMRGVLEHLRDRPEISHWEPMNEPILDPQRYSDRMYCYCPATRAKFLDWLKRKYGSLDALNFAWARSHGCWEDVRPPSYRKGYAQWIDWRRFLIENVAEVVRWRTEVIRSIASQPVVAHTYEAMTCCDFVTKAYDDWRTAQAVDKWGVSRFPGSGEGATIMALESDAVRNQAQGKEFWQSELKGGRGGGGTNIEPLPRAEEFAIWSWVPIAHGAKGLLYWQFRNERHGDECGNMGLCDNAGRPTITALVASKICRTISENEDLFLRARYPKPEVAIVMSPLSYMVDWCSNHNVNLSMDSMTGWYSIFWEASIPVDIHHEEFVSLEKLREYKLVVLPFPICLDDGFNELLVEYVRAGGWVISDPAINLFDGRLFMSKEVPGKELRELFGCRQKEIVSGATPKVRFGAGSEVSLERSHFTERYTEVEGDVLATYEDGEPAVISHRYGKGKAVLSGVNLGMVCTPPRTRSERGKTPAEGAVRDFVLGLLEQAGASRPIVTDREEVTANLLEAGEEALLFVFNHSQKGGKVRVRLKRQIGKAIDLESGQKVSVSKEDERSVVDFRFDGMGVKVLRVG